MFSQLWEITHLCQWNSCDWREVLWVIGGSGLVELTLCPRTCWENKNGWMWVIPQTETDNKRATEQEERALVMWLLMSVYCKSPCWFWCVFFFSGCSSGRCCFFLVSWGDVAFKERQRRWRGGGGLAFSPCQIKDKTKALISFNAQPDFNSRGFHLLESDWSPCLHLLHIYVPVWPVGSALLHREVFKAANAAWNSFKPDISLHDCFLFSI